MSAVVSTAKLRFAYGKHVVLDGIDLEVEAGEVFGIVGPDGAGKSTLLQLLIGQLVPQSGAVSVLGAPASDATLRRRIAYMPQTFGQYVDLTVAENLAFFADLHGVEPEAARALIADLLERTGLSAHVDRRAGQLSGGMMQKLALACALVSRPQVMFLDEPTTGVDPVSRRAFWQLLDQVRVERVAIAYATANMEEAERCDRVALLSGGRFARQGPPLDLIREVAAPLYTLTGPAVRSIRARVRSGTPATLVFPVGNTLRVWLDAAEDEAPFRAALARVAPAVAVSRTHPSLHDVALRDLALAEGRGHADVAQRH